MAWSVLVFAAVSVLAIVGFALQSPILLVLGLLGVFGVMIYAGVQM